MKNNSSKRIVICVDSEYKGRSYQFDEYVSLTASEIENILHFTPNSLFVRTPFEKRKLEPTSKPLELYPNLLNHSSTSFYFRPAYYLETCLDSSPLTIYIEVKTTNNIQIPPFPFAVDNEADLEQPQLLLDRIVNAFSLEVTNSEIEGVHSSSSRLVLKTTLLPSAEKIVRMRVNVLEEVLSTETKYIKELDALLDFWEPKTRNIFSASDHELIFGHFNQIRITQNLFFTNFKKRMCGYSTVSSDLFIDFSNVFKISMDYVADFPKVNQCVSRLSSRNKSKLASLASENEGKILMTALITPIQRMPRYFLFVKELRKYTPSSHPDYELIHFALKSISNVTVQFDGQTKRNEQIERLLQVQHLLPKGINLFDDHRRLTLEKPVEVNSESAHLFLFSDFLLVFSDSKKVLFAQLLRKTQSFPGYPDPTSLCLLHDTSTRQRRITSPAHLKPHLEELVKTNSKMVVANFLNLESLFEVTKALANNFQDPNSFSCSNIFPRDTIPTLLSPSISIQGSNIYVYDGLLHPNDIFILNPFTGFFKTIDTPVVPRNATLVTFHDDVYLFGGAFKHQLNKYTWKRCSGGWKQIAGQSFPQRVQFSTNIYQNRIYIFGGIGQNEFNDIYFLDLTDEESSWTHVDSFNPPPPRCSHTASIYKDTLFIYGGTNNDIPLSDFWKFDFSTGTWTHIKTFPKKYSRASHHAIIRSHYLIVIGNNMSKPVLAIGLLEARIKSFSFSGQVQSIRDGFSVVSLDTEDFLIIGGDIGRDEFLNTCTRVSIPLVFLSSTNYDSEGLETEQGKPLKSIQTAIRTSKVDVELSDIGAYDPEDDASEDINEQNAEVIEDETFQFLEGHLFSSVFSPVFQNVNTNVIVSLCAFLLSIITFSIHIRSNEPYSFRFFLFLSSFAFLLLCLIHLFISRRY